MSTAIIEAEQSDANRRTDIERELDEVYHVDYKYCPGLKPTNFDGTRSAHNQARFDPIIPETVELYTESLRRGDIFPPVLAWRPTPRGRLVMIDGNHRLAAHSAAGKLIDVYEIDRGTHPKTISLLTAAANRKHGVRTTSEEAVFAALHLVNGGATPEASATALNVDLKSLKAAIAKQKAQERADEVGIKRNEWDALPSSAKNRLLAITTDEGFKAASELSARAHLNTGEIFELVGQLNSTKSGDKQRKLVKDLSALHQRRIQEGASGVMTSGHRKAIGSTQRLNLGLGQLLALPDDDTAVLKGYDAAEKGKVAEKLRTVASRLNGLADTLAPIKA